jgi:HEAT repeat protein
LQDPICLRRSDAAADLLLGGPSAVPVLTELLRNDNAQVRAAAAWGLGCAGDRATEAVPALTNLLNDNHPADPAFGTVSEAAARALKRIQAEAGAKARLK